MKPEVSIITCSLEPTLLNRTFNSINSQGFSAWEWIVVSPEPTNELDKFKTKIDFSEKLISITDQKKGIYAAMNLGASASNTNYLVFLNEGDEFYNSESLGHLINSVKGRAWAYGAMEKMDSLKNVNRQYSFQPYNRLLHRLGWKYVPHPSSIVSRLSFENVGGFNVNEVISADQELFLKLSLISKPGLTRAVIAIFHLGGSSSRSVKEAMRDARRISNSIFGPFISWTYIDKLFWKVNEWLKVLLKALFS